MHRSAQVLVIALLTVGIHGPAATQPPVDKGTVATLKIPKRLLTEDRGMGGRYFHVTVEETEYGVVVASRPDWRSVAPSELVEHTVLKTKWRKSKKKKGVVIPGYTEVSLLRSSDREIVRLRILNTRKGPVLDRIFWEVAFSGTLSHDQIQDYLESVRVAPQTRVVGAQKDPASSEFKSRFFTTSDGLRLHYLDVGRGTLIILIPGWAMPARIWEGQMVALSREHRVVALDPRSQGQSESTGEGLYPERRAQDIQELIQHLNTGRPVLVGWSLAVQELLAYADEYGTQAIRGVVFVDGPVKTNGERTQTVRGRILHEIQRDRANLMERFVRGMYRQPQEEAYLRQVVRWTLDTPTSSAFTLLGEYLVMDRDLSEALAKVSCPLLYAITPGLRDEADLVTRRLPRARIEVFEGAGHALFVDEAERFTVMLRDFAAGL